MAPEQVALAVGAALVALFCIWRGQWRGALWIAAGTASFTLSTWYGRQTLPYPEAVTALCDAAICFAIYFSARERWERFLFLIFQGSVLVSLSYFAGLIGPHWAYIVGLEIINWLALSLIGGTALLSWLGNAYGYRRGLVGYLRGAHRLVWAPRSPPGGGR